MSLPCIPHELPITHLNWKQLIEPVGQANSLLSRYDGLLQSIINAEVMLAPLTTREAVLSSRIEGTQASLSEVLEHEAGEEYDKEKTLDIHEILNYRGALTQAERTLETCPITLNLIKAIHKILMEGVRGRDKLPGEFRADQNWIGSKGCTMQQARFVPPSPIILPEHLEKWERYVQDPTEDPLIKLAILHAQFEILHPFKDGNGRIGRLLIPLFLYKRKTLHRPMFYLSEYLEDNREMYYDKLLAITERNDWQSWVEFFLQAITKQSSFNIEKVIKIQKLYEKLKIAFTDATHSQYAFTALDVLFAKPVIHTTDFIKRARIPNDVTAGSILRKLNAAGYINLLRKGSGRRPSVYVLPELVNIAEGRKIFPVKVKMLA
jgi:Fic family protein